MVNLDRRLVIGGLATAAATVFDSPKADAQESAHIPITKRDLAVRQVGLHPNTVQQLERAKVKVHAGFADADINNNAQAYIKIPTEFIYKGAKLYDPKDLTLDGYSTDLRTDTKNELILNSSSIRMLHVGFSSDKYDLDSITFTVFDGTTGKALKMRYERP
jgi:hypothetical protein